MVFFKNVPLSTTFQIMAFDWLIKEDEELVWSGLCNGLSEILMQVYFEGVNRLKGGWKWEMLEEKTEIPEEFENL